MEAIKERVRKLTARFGTSDPRELCDYLNITVLEMALHAQMQGFFLRVEDTFFIYVNRDQSEEDKRATIAHELGHRMLHPRLNSLFMMRSTLMHPGKYEREADLFACHLLVDDACFEEDGESRTLEQLSCELGVPLPFVELKWEELQHTEE